MDATQIFLDILVVLVAAKLAGELAERVQLPAVCGEIFAGVLVGPSLLGWVHTGETMAVLAELGVILLLFSVGLETDVNELLAVGRASLSVAVVGVVLPFVAGYGAAIAIGIDSDAAVFIGAALTATSVGITARVFGDMRALTTIEARTVLGAAVADDVIGLVVLTVVVGIIADGNVSAAGIAWVIIEAIGFLVIASYLGIKLAPRAFAMVTRHGRSAGTLVALALAFTLGMAQLAHLAKLAPIIGAFVAGLALRASPVADRVHRDFTPVGHIFIPVFFLQIGIEADVSQFASAAVLRDAALLLAVAIAGKLASSLVLRRGQGDRLLIGIGMVPRGEVGLIFATIGLDRGIFGDDVYAALLLVVIASTIVAPPLLRMRLSAMRQKAHTTRVGAPRALAEWFTSVGDDRFDLVDEPPVESAIAVSLHAAVLGRDRAPGNRLLEWVAALPDEPLVWDRDARTALFELLENGNARSWRFLAISGVIDRAIPELADGVGRRQRDLSNLDPLHGFVPARVAALRTIIHEHELTHPEHVALAAFLLDLAPEPDMLTVARAALVRIGVSSAAQSTIGDLLRDRSLMRDAVRRFDVLEEESIAQFAAHVQSEERARALLVLALADGDLEPLEQARLQALYELMIDTLGSDLGAQDVTSVVEERRVEAMTKVTNTFVRDRIAAAPRAYVLASNVDELVRHAQLLEPPPDRRSVRVCVTPADGGTWQIDVAAHDRVGLIARETQVFAALGIDVLDARAVTWGDHQAVASYWVRASQAPLAANIERAIGELLEEPVTFTPVPEAHLEFDDHASPWHTICRVEATDRAGLLHAVTSAFAVAGVSVHAARVVTQGGSAIDVFELNQGEATKLSMAARAAVTRALHFGDTENKGRRRGVRLLSGSTSRYR